MTADAPLLREVFKIAPVETVEGRKYYAIGQRAFETLCELAKDKPELQPAVDEAITQAGQFWNGYLVPADQLWGLKE